MAIKTNSKEAKKAIMNYIREATETGLQDYNNPKNYNLANDAERAAFIWDIFQAEKYYDIVTIKRRAMAIYPIFEMWLQGLPGCGLGDHYIYNPDPRDTLGDILKQTKTERNRYTMEDAAAMLSNLIYREITANKIVK